MSDPTSGMPIDATLSEEWAEDAVGPSENGAEAFAAATSAAKKIWDSSENETYRKDNSHYRGVGRWADEVRWKSIGQNALRAMNRHIGSTTSDPYYWTQERDMLEWGPGGGSNAYAFRKLVRHYYGVDISRENLEETRRVTSEDGTKSFVPVLINDTIDDVVNTVRQPIDLFLSTAVFQHFPSKDYGVEVLKCIHRIMKPGGVGLVQTRFDNGNPKYKPIETLEEYQEKHITATSYALDEFFCILEDIGFDEIMITGLNRDINYVTYLFCKAHEM